MVTSLLGPLKFSCIRSTLHKIELKRILTGLQSCQCITINKIVDTLANETAAEAMNQPGSGYTQPLCRKLQILSRRHINKDDKTNLSKEDHAACWPQGYKTFFMLNSTEHEIFAAHKC